MPTYKINQFKSKRLCGNYYSLVIFFCLPSSKIGSKIAKSELSKR